MSPESSDQESRDQSLDVMSISSSDFEVGLGLDSSSDRLSSEHPLPSVLDILKSPTPSELARKRKVASNKPPVGRKRGKGRVTSSPMSVRPLDRVKSYPGGFCLIVDIVVANSS